MSQLSLTEGFLNWPEVISWIITLRQLPLDGFLLKREHERQGE